MLGKSCELKRKAGQESTQQKYRRNNTFFCGGQEGGGGGGGGNFKIRISFFGGFQKAEFRCEAEKFHPC